MLGFLYSATPTLTIAANRMKIEALGLPKNSTFTSAYYMERQLVQGRRLLLLFPNFWSIFFEINSGVLFFD